MSCISYTPNDPAIRKPRPDGDYCLSEPLTIKDGFSSWTIPSGFSTDLASVPRPMRWLIANDDLGYVAPIAHDFLYRNGGRVGMLFYSRAQADELFNEIMKVDGVPNWRRKTAFTAVRLFGSFVWRTET